MGSGGETLALMPARYQEIDGGSVAYQSGAAADDGSRMDFEARRTRWDASKMTGWQ
jgi:hypothetical protein